MKGVSINTLNEIGLSTYSVTDLALRVSRLSQYFKLSIPPKDFDRVKRLLEEHDIAIVCIDAPDFLDLCLDDVQTT